MKRLANTCILALILLFSFSKSSAQSSVIGNPIKIGNLLVAEFDFPNQMGQKDAIKACNSLGNGWRLPTKDESIILCKYFCTQSIKKTYWSSNTFVSGTKITSILLSGDGSQKTESDPQYLKSGDGWKWAVYEDKTWLASYIPNKAEISVRAVRTFGVESTKKTVKSIDVIDKSKRKDVPSGIIDGVSQQDLLNALFADDLKPSSQKSNNSSTSSSTKIINSNSVKKSHEFNVIVQWQKTCGNCPFPLPSIQNGLLLSQPSTRSGYYNLQPICPTCGKKPYGELSGNTNNMVGGSKTFRVVCKGN